MARDARGNDLQSTFVPVDAALLLVPYAQENAISKEVISSPDPKLPAAYDPGTAAVGLIESGGGLHFARNGGHETTFLQRGYSLTGSPTLTCQFTIAELNDLVQSVEYGKPDSNGVYDVDDIISSEKWCVYIKEIDKWGRERRTAGVVQLTANAPAADSNGTVTGEQWTLTFQPDDIYDGHQFRRYTYVPAGTDTHTDTPADPKNN